MRSFELRTSCLKFEFSNLEHTAASLRSLAAASFKGRQFVCRTLRHRLNSIRIARFVLLSRVLSLEAESFFASLRFGLVWFGLILLRLKSFLFLFSSLLPLRFGSSCFRTVRLVWVLEDFEIVERKKEATQCLWPLAIVRRVQVSEHQFGLAHNDGSGSGFGSGFDAGTGSGFASFFLIGSESASCSRTTKQNALVTRQERKQPSNGALRLARTAATITDETMRRTEPNRTKPNQTKIQSPSKKPKRGGGKIKKGTARYLRAANKTQTAHNRSEQHNESLGAARNAIIVRHNQRAGRTVARH